MPLPGNLTTIQVTGTFLDSQGNPLSGSISFAPPPELVDINTAIMYSTPVTAVLDSNGHFSVTLIATDNSTLAPAGWSYTVAENVRTARTYTIYVPHTLGTTVDLSTLIPLPTLTGSTSSTSVSAVAPGYAALAYNNNWSGVNTYTGEVIVPTPVNPSDAVTKAYADALSQGLTVKPSVQVATTAALPSNTYANGSSGIGATLTATANGALTVDGVAVEAGDRVLVMNEATAANNGIYTATQPGSSSTPYVLTRTADFDLATQIPGAFAFVEQGTVNAGNGFVVANEGPFTIGTTAISFTQFSGTGTITVGSGLVKNGNTLSLGVPVPVAFGGTGQATTQAALNALAGGTTAAQYLRGNGTNVVLSAIQAADLPAATGAAQGAIELTGDLGGTAASPQVVTTHLAAPLPLAQGGTGSATQNFVDLTSNQTIAGTKTFGTAPALPGGSAVALGWVNVKAYGAKGDGVTDDTAAIQAAINALTAGVVYFPPSTSGYLLNSSALSVASAGIVLRGDGAENTKLIIGGSFTGSAAVSITAYNCQVKYLSINGVSTTTISNPVADAIRITGVRRARVDAVTFFNINGWCVNVQATTSSSTSNELGTVLTRLYGSSCAGGIHFLGNTTQGYAVNSQVSNCSFYTGGVTTGASANLDGILVEDSWDVLLENNIVWMSSGTGSCLHIKGKSAATFVTNLDALGPSTGPCVLIEDGTNGSPQNVQIIGGVIQQGSPGILLTGGAAQVHISTSRIINNYTHGIQIAGTNSTIFLSELFYSLNGAGATGTNYDLNWSGTAVGYVTNNRFATPVVATGTAGVQNPVNVATAGQNVRFINTSFQGSGSSSSNWFTNLPSAVFDLSSGSIAYYTGVAFNASSGTSVAVTGGSTGQRLFGTTGFDATSIAHGVGVIGQSFDSYRQTCDGAMNFGPGTGSRDTNWSRQGAAVIGSTNSDIATGLAGKGFRTKEGSNAKQGTAVLAAGTVTVANTSVTANSRIFLTIQTPGGTVGSVYVSARTAGTSFTITSTSNTDTSTVAYEIFEPA
jgi:hypothetical protein